MLPGVALRSLLLWLVLQPVGALAELTADVDTREITTEQSLRLVVSSTKPNSNDQPDFSELSKDFELLGRSEQTNVQTIGQTMTQTRSWHLELMPKRVGPATIPVFTVGGESSQEIGITVLAPKVRKPGESKGEYYLEASVDQSTVYVQAQVIYTLRIFSVQNFLDGGLSEVKAEGAQVQELGDSRSYREVINGQPYQVLEKKYVIFPQRSGEIVVPAVLLDASVPRKGARNRGIFTPSQNIRRKSEALTITALPRPDASGSDWWLPAVDVQLAGNWEGDVAALRVGDSVTRNMALLAEGVSSTQLPQLPLPQNTNFKAYASQPQFDDQVTADGLKSVRQEKWAVVALTPGTFTLPEIKVPWFNTRTGQTEVAVLPAETLTVLPAETDQAATGPDSNGQINPLQSDQGTATGGADSSEDSAKEIAMLSASLENMTIQLNRWKWFAIALGIALLFGLSAAIALWFRQGKGRPIARHKPPQAPSLSEVEKACRSGDARACSTALLAWARGYWPEDPPRTLVALADRLNSPQLSQALSDLDSSLYARDAAVPETLKTLAQQIPDALKQRASGAQPDQASALPGL